MPRSWLIFVETSVILSHRTSLPTFTMSADLPKTMKALQYSEPRKYGIVELPLPELRENDILVWLATYEH